MKPFEEAMDAWYAANGDVSCVDKWASKLRQIYKACHLNDPANKDKIPKSDKQAVQVGTRSQTCDFYRLGAHPAT